MKKIDVNGLSSEIYQNIKKGSTNPNMAAVEKLSSVGKDLTFEYINRVVERVNQDIVRDNILNSAIKTAKVTIIDPKKVAKAVLINKKMPIKVAGEIISRDSTKYQALPNEIKLASYKPAGCQDNALALEKKASKGKGEITPSDFLKLCTLAREAKEKMAFYKKEYKMISSDLEFALNKISEQASSMNMAEIKNASHWAGEKIGQYASQMIEKMASKEPARTETVRYYNPGNFEDLGNKIKVAKNILDKMAGLKEKVMFYQEKLDEIAEKVGGEK